MFYRVRRGGSNEGKEEGRKFPGRNTFLLRIECSTPTLSVALMRK